MSSVFRTINFPAITQLETLQTIIITTTIIIIIIIIINIYIAPILFSANRECSNFSLECSKLVYSMQERPVSEEVEQ